MKKLVVLLLVAVLVVAMAACGQAPSTATNTPGAPSVQPSAAATESAQATEGTETADKAPHIGFVVYDYSNAYMAYFRKGIENYCADGNKATLEEVDSANDQAKQNDQVNTLIQKGVDVLIVNLVDPGAGQAIQDAAKAANIPLVFINRAPDLSILDKYDKCWYVGISWDDPGIVQAQGIKADWTAKQSEMDKNGDGVLQYVLVQGNISQQDGIYRTKAVVDSFATWNTDGSLKNEQLDIQEAGWDTTKAKELMETWLVKYGNDIEAVVCNNDAMAMGVIQALQGNGYYDDASKKVWVYGINALPQVMPLLENGQLAGTVLTSPWIQAVATVDICVDTFNGRDPLQNPELHFSAIVDGDGGKEIRAEDQAINLENKADAEDAYGKCS
jgi:methyl-galactoside transport system substrate-binding protein